MRCGEIRPKLCILSTMVGLVNKNVTRTVALCKFSFSAYLPQLQVTPMSNEVKKVHIFKINCFIKNIGMHFIQFSVV